MIFGMPNELASLTVTRGLRVCLPSESKSDVNMYLHPTESHPRRAAARCQRPTALLTGRNRSESPVTRSKSRPVELSVSSPIDENATCDPESLQAELEHKSGMLTFGVQSLSAKMDDFISECLLGSGTCSEVYKMRHRTKPELVMAVKHMRRSSTCPEENKRIMRDLYIVTKCNDCAYIVHCFGIFLTASDVWICMEVMSTCLDKLLRDLHRPFPEKVLGKVTVSITTALDYLKHKHNVMHRDVKPSNMLLSFEGIIKLCDFGISGELKDSIARSRQLGCIGYMAPERLESSSYDVRADVWSLGISLLELATGSFPYKGTEIEFAIMSKIISEPPPSLPDHIPCSPAFRHFIDLCLKKDHRQRPKYHALMNTEFFRRYSVPPCDVLDWLRCIPLKYLQRSNSRSPTHRTELNSSSSPSLHSPASNSTLSPDVSLALGNVSLGDSFERSTVEKGSTSQNGLDVVLVAAPTVVVGPPPPPPHTGKQASYVSTNSAARSNLQPVVSHGSSSYTPPVIVSGTRIVMEPATAASLQSQEPLSHASSGYGSAGSEGSPGSVINNTGSPNTGVSEARHMNSGPTHRLRTPVIGSGTETQSSGTTFLGRPDSSSKVLRSSQVNLHGASGKNLDCSDSHVNSAQWSTSASSRTRTQHSTGTKCPEVSNVVAPLIKKFEPGRCLDANRFGFNHFERVGQPENPTRSFTPPLPSKKNVSTTALPFNGGDRFTRQDAQQPPYSQIRSASVGRNLHRSHAQRWPSRPLLYNKAQTKPAKGFADSKPPLSDALAVSCAPTVRRSVETGDTNSQNYHHHYFHYYHHRPIENTNQKTQATPLSVDTISSNLTPMACDKASRSNHSSLYSGGTRLAHRLLTHPLPRQTTATAIYPTNQSNNHLCKSSSHLLSPISQLEKPSVPCRIPRLFPGGSEAHSRFSHRSSSQPATAENYRNTSSSFETDL